MRAFLPWVLTFLITSLLGIAFLELLKRIRWQEGMPMVPLQNRGRAVKNTSYWLDSGDTADYYYDVDLLLEDPNNVLSVTQSLFACVKDAPNITAIAFIEKHFGPIGMLSMKDHLAFAVNLPAMVVRVRKRIPSEMVKPALPPASRSGVLLISDVATTGDTLLEAIDVLRDRGCNVIGAFVVYDKRQGSQEALEARGLKFWSIERRGAVAEKLLGMLR